jgi:hypothetical protein
MAAYPSSDIRPASVMRIRSTMSVIPRSATGSVTTIAFGVEVGQSLIAVSTGRPVWLADRSGPMSTYVGSSFGRSRV